MGGNWAAAAVTTHIAVMSAAGLLQSMYRPTTAFTPSCDTASGLTRKAMQPSPNNKTSHFSDALHVAQAHYCNKWTENTASAC